MGRIRVLRQPRTLLLGAAAAPDRHPRRPPVAFALTGAKAGERQTLLSILAAGPGLAASRPGQILIAGRQYYGTAFEAELTGQHLHLLRPAARCRQRSLQPKFVAVVRSRLRIRFRYARLCDICLRRQCCTGTGIRVSR